MVFTIRIQRAIRFAIKTHEVYQKQKRKGKDIPYITHPLTVGMLLARAGCAEDVIIAGILHDTIEDSPTERRVTPSMINERFGARVRNMVVNVTESQRHKTWQERKDLAIAHIAKIDHDSMLVKSADLVSNASDILEDFHDVGDQVFERFHAPKAKTLWFYTTMIDTMLRHCKRNPFEADLRYLVKQLRALVSMAR